MKRKTIRNIGLSLLTAALISSAGVSGAVAYFTTYTTAQGGYVIHLGDRTDIRESFDSWTKHVTVTSDPDSEPVYVRARAFCARYDLAYTSESGRWTSGKGGWNEVVPAGEDAFYYYTEIVHGGESTDALDVVIQIPAGEDASWEDGDSFQVIVIYESTPVRYHEDGTPYADWTKVLDASADVGIGGGTGGDKMGGDGDGAGAAIGPDGNGSHGAKSGSENRSGGEGDA